MLHRPAHITYHIFSICSRTTLGCTSKFTNLILTDSFTNRTFWVCLSVCYVYTWPFSGFRFQEISFSITVVYCKDRAKCKIVLLFTHPQTLDGDLSYHTDVAAWYSLISFVSQYSLLRIMCRPTVWKLVAV